MLLNCKTENETEKCEICGKILTELLITKETRSTKCIVYKCSTCGVKKFVFSQNPSEQTRNLCPFIELVDHAINHPIDYFSIIKNQLTVKGKSIDWLFTSTLKNLMDKLLL